MILTVIYWWVYQGHCRVNITVTFCGQPSWTTGRGQTAHPTSSDKIRRSNSNNSATMAYTTESEPAIKASDQGLGVYQGSGRAIFISLHPSCSPAVPHDERIKERKPRNQLQSGICVNTCNTQTHPILPDLESVTALLWLKMKHWKWPPIILPLLQNSSHRMNSQIRWFWIVLHILPWGGGVDPTVTPYQ